MAEIVNLAEHAVRKAKETVQQFKLEQKDIYETEEFKQWHREKFGREFDIEKDMATIQAWQEIVALMSIDQPMTAEEQQRCCSLLEQIQISES